MCRGWMWFFAGDQNTRIDDKVENYPDPKSPSK